jgi:hypothetical protein
MTTTIARKRQRYDLEEFPAHLLRVPGILGQMTTWMDACAVRPAPILSLGASIATLSTLCGRWYKSRTGLRANLYLVGLARSGAGKENGRACAMTMLARSGLTLLRGTDDLASSAGLLRIMHEYPVRLFCLDEIGLMLGNVTSKQAGTHERDILSVLMRLHSTAGTSWAGKAYAEKDSKAIEQPHCVVWGTSTGERFWDSLSGSHTVDGFLNRLVVLPHHGEIPRVVEPTADPAAPPADLLEVCAAIGSGALVGLKDTLGGVVTSQTRTTSRRVDQTEGATLELSRCADGQLAKQNTSSCPEAWTRVLEQATRLALVCAVSLRPEDPVIDEDCARWGTRLAWWSVSLTARAAEERVGDTEEQRAAQRVMAAITKAGGTLSQRGLTRATQRLDRRHRDAAIRTLLDAGRLGEVHNHGRNGQIVKSFQALTDDVSPDGVTGEILQ